MRRQRIGIALKNAFDRVQRAGHRIARTSAGLAGRVAADGKDVRRVVAFVLLLVFISGTGAVSMAHALGPVDLPAGIDPAPAPGMEGGGLSAGGSGAAAQAVGQSTDQNAGVKLSEDDIYLLARLINGEARGEPYEGQVAVGAVILNRMKSNLFPNTVAEVIYQPGQYEVVANGQINLTPEASCLAAAREAAAGKDPTGGALYFFAFAKTSSAFLWSRPLKVTIGGHRFTS